MQIIKRKEIQNMNAKHLIRNDLSALVPQYPSNFISKKSAFTLAEVLITLGIIGVVAALTIFTLVTNYQKRTTVTQLKKVYTTLSQAFELAQAENGSSIYWIQNRNSYFRDYFLPYLNVANYCVLPECESKGIHFGIDGNKFEVPLLKQIKSFPVDSQAYIVILSDGTMLYIYQSLYQNYWTLNIWVDLNGNKGPNRTGRDIFSLFLFSGAKGYWVENVATVNEKPGIYFTGGFLKNRDKIMYESGISNCSSLGITCGALIQYDGWKIESDYPW